MCRSWYAAGLGQDSSADGLVDKVAKVKKYSDHLTQVFADRRLLDVLLGCEPRMLPHFVVVMGDGMDQAHWRLPRDPGLKTVKSIASLKRPQCVVHMIWVYGIHIRFYISDCDMAHDSSMITECLAQSLEKTAELLAASGKKMPSALLYIAMALVVPSTPVFSRHMILHPLCSLSPLNATCVDALLWRLTTPLGNQRTNTCSAISCTWCKNRSSAWPQS